MKHLQNTKPIPTSKLDGATLDWAVAQCEGVDVDICLDSLTTSNRGNILQWLGVRTV